MNNMLTISQTTPTPRKSTTRSTRTQAGPQPTDLPTERFTASTPDTDLERMKSLQQMARRRRNPHPNRSRQRNSTISPNLTTESLQVESSIQNRSGGGFVRLKDDDGDSLFVGSSHRGLKAGYTDKDGTQTGLDLQDRQVVSSVIDNLSQVRERTEDGTPEAKHLDIQLRALEGRSAELKTDSRREMLKKLSDLVRNDKNSYDPDRLSPFRYAPKSDWENE